MSTVIELTVADNEHEDIAIVWHAHQSYSGLGALGIWARRSRHGVAVRSVPGGNMTNRTIPHEDISKCVRTQERGELLFSQGVSISFYMELDAFSLCRPSNSLFHMEPWINSVARFK
jgi:hypothetical protein